MLLWLWIIPLNHPTTLSKPVITVGRVAIPPKNLEIALLVALQYAGYVSAATGGVLPEPVEELEVESLVAGVNEYQIPL